MKPVHRWNRATRKQLARVRGRRSPDRNLEYLLYQTLLGFWPLPRRDVPRDEPPPAEVLAELEARAVAYALKAAREAKVHTGWVDSDEAWEEGVTRFVRAIFDDPAMVRDITAVAAEISRPGLWNALAHARAHGARRS